MDQKFIETIKLRHLQVSSKLSGLGFEKWSNDIFEVLYPNS